MHQNNKNKSKRIFTATVFLIVFSVLVFPPNKGLSQGLTDDVLESKQQVDTLNSEINKKQSRVKELEGLIGKYKLNIDSQEQQQASLANDLILLDNRIIKKELDIERTRVELDLTTLEIKSLDQQIVEHGKRIDRQKTYAAEILRNIRKADDVPVYEVMLKKPSLSSFFDRVEEQKKLGDKLNDTLQEVKNDKETLENTKTSRDAKKTSLEAKKKELKEEEIALAAERNFKASLIAETKNKQSEYERVVYELQQQQQMTAEDINLLETRLKDTLDSVDEALARGDVLLNWPLKRDIIVTARFHDPNYPFRKRFAHPGIDLRAAVGTPIYAAAGGYVAWTKLGSAYGNYLMLVHPGSIATIYAHLSKFVAKPDTYVQRGQLIGYSGGMPGQPGAGLSTGPHLHFEVRQNGIPVDPENFTPSLEADAFQNY